jgi:hypothetical protein
MQRSPAEERADLNAVAGERSNSYFLDEYGFRR